MLFNTFFHICIKTLFSISGHCQLEDADYQYKSGLYFEKDETDPIIDMAQIFRPLLSSLIGREWWDRSRGTLRRRACTKRSPKLWHSGMLIKINIKSCIVVRD